MAGKLSHHVVKAAPSATRIRAGSFRNADHGSSSPSRREPRPILMSQGRRLTLWRRSMPDRRGAVDSYMMVGEVCATRRVVNLGHVARNALGGGIHGT
jgi:hypothetical protein